MNRLIKKPKIYIGIGISLVVISIVLPFWINSNYLEGYKQKIEPNTILSANDWINYWGALLTFLGTGILGITAMLQNDQLNERNIEIEEENKQIQMLMAQQGIPVLVIDESIIPETHTSSDIAELREINSISIETIGQRSTHILNIYHYYNKNSPCQKYNCVFVLKNVTKAIIGSIEIKSITLQKSNPPGQVSFTFPLEKLFIEMANKFDLLLLPEEKMTLRLNIFCDDDFIHQITNLFTFTLKLKLNLVIGYSYEETIIFRHIKGETLPIEYNIY
jgi:hypothetical protein